MQYRIDIRATQHSLNVELHQIDEATGKARFGYNAEAAMTTGFGYKRNEFEFGAGQGSIGRAAPADAMIRARLYEKAAEIAAWLEAFNVSTEDGDIFVSTTSLAQALGVEITTYFAEDSDDVQGIAGSTEFDSLPRIHGVATIR